LIAVRSAALLVLLAVGTAHAAPFTPPPLSGHVADPAGKLGADRARVDSALARIKSKDRYTIAALVIAGTDDPIDDVAYRTFNAWKLGDAKLDDGILIVVAPDQRQARIETGKGIGGDLTDLQAADVIRVAMGPLLAKGALADAITAGATAIVKQLPSRVPVAVKRTSQGISRGWKIGFGAFLAILVGGCIVSIFNERFRKVFFGILFAFTYLFRILAFFASKGGSSSSSASGGGRSGGGGASGKY
jgi:uncharacterized protein